MAEYQLEPADIKVGKIRKIYYEVPYEEYETEWVRQIKEAIDVEIQPLPEYVDNALILKSAESSSGDVAKAIEIIKSYINWRSTELPVDRGEVAHLLEQRLLYFTGKDICNRPVFIANIAGIVASEVTQEQLMRLAYYVLNKATGKHFVRGKVETWIMIFDLKDVNVTGIPVTMLKNLASTLSKYYQCCLHRMFVINSPMMINLFWNVVKAFLEEGTREKIQIFGSRNWQEELSRQVQMDGLEQKYGGNRPNFK